MSAIALVHEPPNAIALDALVDGVRAGETWARARLYDRHAPEVARVLLAILGPDAELRDLVHETFVEAFEAIARLRDRTAISPWIRQIAVNRARRCIRRRVRSRWLDVFGLGDAHEPVAPSCSPESREALGETYRILDALAPDLRLPFALRHLEGLELEEIAGACDVSLATIKRRLATAEKRFFALARTGGKLDDWLLARDERSAP